MPGGSGRELVVKGEGEELRNHVELHFFIPVPGCKQPVAQLGLMAILRWTCLHSAQWLI